MAQTVPFDLYLGPTKTGVALGAIVYEADGTTVYASFSTSGWYEEPDGTGDWHHPGVTFPDAGGVLAYGVSGTEYRRYSVDAAGPTATTIADAVLSRSVTSVEDTASIYTIAGLILAAFESTAPSTTWTINKTDGVTPFATRSLTEDENAKPVTGVG